MQRTAMTTKHFTGGASIDANQIHIHLQIGGQTQARAYNTIDQSIDKLTIIAEALSKIQLESTADAIFYLEQLIILFQPTRISLLPNIGSYQIAHNIHILNAYIQACMEPFSTNESMQLLGCSRIIHELESDLAITDQLACCIQLTDSMPQEQFEHRDTTCDEDRIPIVQAAKQLRDRFIQYIQAIESKKVEIGIACNKIIKQIDSSLPH
jgi:hypothetical protein